MKLRRPTFGALPLIAALSFFVASCATPNEMRAKPPDMTLASARPAKDVSMCIADRWENAGPIGGTVPVTMRPTKQGYTVAWRNEALGHTGLLVDVEEQGAGSRTKYFKGAVLGEIAFDRAVKDCQQTG